MNHDIKDLGQGDFTIEKMPLTPQDKDVCYCGNILTYTGLPDGREIQCKCGLFWYVWDDGESRGIEEAI